MHLFSFRSPPYTGAYTFGDTSTGDVSVSLACTDGSGSGCGVTLYCTDTLGTCTPNLTYTIPVVISAEGTNYIRYSSTDTVSNSEITKSQTIKITVPVVTPAGGGGAGGNAMQAFANQNNQAPQALKQQLIAELKLKLIDLIRQLILLLQERIKNNL
jgi:hypothetical protein